MSQDPTFRVLGQTPTRSEQYEAYRRCGSRWVDQSRKAMIDRGLRFVLVDVRTEEERAVAEIGGSRLYSSSSFPGPTSIANRQ